jgi:hypothetical protein
MFEDVATDGSTYIYAVGGGESYGWGPFAMVLAKYDTSGNRINMVTEPGLTLGFDPCFLYQNVGQSWSQGVIVHNNNIYVVGVSALTGVGEDSVPRPFLSKFDSNLNRQWKRRPTDLGPGGFRGVTGVGSAIYAVGYTYTSGVANSEDYLIQKYDEDGNLLWSRASGGLNTDILTGVVGIGSRLFAVGYTRSQGAGGADAVILEIDPANGDTLSTTLFGDAQDDMANGVATDGTDLYVVGESRSFTVGGNAVGQNDLMLLRFTLAAPNTPPVAVCQNVTVEADSICTANASIDNGSYDPDGDPITLTQSPAGPYPLGGTLVTLTVSDDKGESSQCTGTVTVVDNTAPTITCPADIVNSTDLGQCSAIQDYTVTAKDNCAGWMVMTSPPSGSNFPKGTTLVTATAIDLARNTATCTFMVAVEDREPPKITGVSANPAVLWPPNHKMVSVAVAAYVSDNCDTAPACKIISVNSNEPENGLGDGDTAPDWQIIPGSLKVNLRAERSGTGSGRVYTITVQCTDASGNTSTRAVQVSVPHDQGKK